MKILSYKRQVYYGYWEGDETHRANSVVEWDILTLTLLNMRPRFWPNGFQIHPIVETYFYIVNNKKTLKWLSPPKKILGTDNKACKEGEN